MLAFSLGAWMILLLKEPCSNSKREEEMGWVKGSGEKGEMGSLAHLEGCYFYYPHSSSIWKLKKGGYGNTNIN